MTLKNTLESRIRYRIKRGKGSVYMISDFLDLSDANQIGRALRNLAKENLIIKIGHGVYARAKISNINGKLLPEKDLNSLGFELVEKLKLKPVKTFYERMYEEGKSTQVPSGRVLRVRGRISRKIGYNGKYLEFQSTSSSRAG